ncbi:MAG: glycosyltransferase family 4 protein [Thermoleophilaceae bacterium]|nr:glycosyltransferase family 4 protein [Thermoleophilaceae bacterium]
MRIRVIDPPAYTPPYDHALCCALAAAGNDVELVTTHFRFGDRPTPDGYNLREHFYRVAGPLPVRVAQHPLDMWRLRRLPPVDVAHFQWLPIQAIDRHLLPPGPVVLTAHDVVPREPRPGQLGALAKTFKRVDAVVVHSKHGRARLIDELDVDPAKVHVIPHGVFDYLATQQQCTPLPPELAAVTRPVVLCFGLMRPYKGIDLLIEAFKAVGPDAELWIVGMPRMPLEPLQALAAVLGDRVRFVPRFVVDSELPAYFERADVVVLPYREIDQSGVLFTALAFGKPLLVTRVGGFSEIADQHSAALAVQPGDSAALANGLDQLLGSPELRAQLAAAAAKLADGEFAWSTIARQTADLYKTLLARQR